LIEKIPFFMFSFLSCLKTLAAQQGAAASIEAIPPISRIENSLISYTEYLAKMVCPFPLAVLYPHPQMFPLLKVTASLFVVLSISLLAIRKLRLKPWLAVGWFWYLGTMVPVIGLIQVGVQGYADRYTYIPLIGLFIMIAWQVPDIVQSWQHKTIIISVIAIGILSVLCVLTSSQIRHWKNNITLFEHALMSTSENYVAQNNLGISFAEKGNFHKAIKHYREAIRIHHGFCDPFYNLGFASYKQGNIQEAILHFRDGIACNPNFAQSYYFSANFYFELKQIDNAIIHYEKALEIRPDYVNAMINLGIAHELIGKSEESLVLFKEAKRIDPDFADARRINMEKFFREKME
jgi:tetratricopeptide (TPR) repeat protein